MHPGSSSLPLWRFDCFDPARLRVAVTTRAGGVSEGSFASLNLGFHVGDDHGAVLANRRRAAAAFGASLDDVVFAEQVAGRRVATVGLPDRGSGAREHASAVTGADGLVTTEPGVVLAMMAADCLLITMYDGVAGVLALVHAGWPGTTSGIIAEAVTAMVGLGAEPSRLVAAIGPAVSAASYQVGDDVAAAARAALGRRADDVLREDGTGRFLFDLPGAARIQLRDAGVQSAAVHVAGAVTGPGTPFFSHRFEGPTGRFAMLAQLTGKAAA